ncbi:MAG: efflux RND transporter periplasmic adaptor subunit [Steroidobacteraceae bacterium]
MNDISRTTDLSVPHLAFREPWWRQTGQRLRHSRAAALVLALLALGALAGLGWFLSHRNAGNEGNGTNARFRAVATVGEAAAVRADVPIYLDALGTVTPLATAVVQAQVSGVLTRVYYREGQTVKQGDPLVQIDPRPFQIALEQSQGNLSRDEANLANQKVIVQRDRVLLQQDSIAQQQVDTDVATLKQLQAVVASDRAALDSARLNLSWSTVTAPISGRVGLRPVDVGNYVTSGLANGVATITQVMPIDVEFALPAEDVPRVEKRLATGAVLTAVALDQSRTTQLATGTFLTLDNQIDSQTGTIHAKARFANANTTLFPQQFVNVHLLLDTLTGATVVPTAAVREGPQGTYVYVISQDHSAHVRLVKTGPSVGDRVSIASGLNVGEEVVTEGGDRLVDGAKVRLPSDIRAPGQGKGGKSARANT